MKYAFKINDNGTFMDREKGKNICPYNYKTQLDGVMCFNAKECIACSKDEAKIQECTNCAQELLVSNIHYMQGFIDNNGINTNCAGNKVSMDVSVAKEKQKSFIELYWKLEKCKQNNLAISGNTAKYSRNSGK